MSEQVTPVRARTMTLEKLKEHTLPLFLDPVPADKTLRKMFAAHQVRTLKQKNKPARGGAPIYYYVADVEKIFAVG